MKAYAYILRMFTTPSPQQETIQALSALSSYDWSDGKTPPKAAPLISKLRETYHNHHVTHDPDVISAFDNFQSKYWDDRVRRNKQLISTYKGNEAALTFLVQRSKFKDVSSDVNGGIIKDPFVRILHSFQDALKDSRAHSSATKTI